jgi:hypothetical protein
MRGFRFILGAALGSVFVTPAGAQQREAALRPDKALGLSVTTGLDFSSGDYGGPDKTRILVAPLSFRLSKGSFRVSATLPYLRLEGPANIVGGGESGPIVIDPTGLGPQRRRQGLGDLSLGVDYLVPAKALGGLELKLGARVKLPTSDPDDGLSTGKTDLALVADLSKPMGAVSPFVTLGYRMPGDPRGFDLRNTLAVSAGSSLTLGKLVAIGSYDYAGASSPLSFASHSLFTALARPLSKRATLIGYGNVGLSRGAADYGVGLLLTFRAK